jgi:hypothetical protein
MRLWAAWDKSESWEPEARSRLAAWASLVVFRRLQESVGKSAFPLESRQGPEQVQPLAFQNQEAPSNTAQLP